MSTLVKIVLGLALALPMAAYAVGSLVASADEPRPRETIVIQPSRDHDRRGDDTRTGQPKDDDARKNDDGGEHNDDEAPGDDGGDGDDDVDTVQPEIQDLDDGDDRSGPGAGDDTDGGTDDGGDD